MAVPSRPASQTKHTVQYMQNASYDGDLNVLAREMLTVNPVSGNAEKVTGIQGNASYAFTWSGGNLTGIAKTVGSTTHNRTLTWTDGDLTAITVWS